MSYVGTEFRFGGAATIQVADSAASTQVPSSLATARLIQLAGTLTATRTVVIATQPGWDWVFQNSTSQIVNVAAQSGGTTVPIAPSAVASIVSTSTGMVAAGSFLSTFNPHSPGPIGDTTPDTLNATYIATNGVTATSFIQTGGSSIGADVVAAGNMYAGGFLELNQSNGNQIRKSSGNVTPNSNVVGSPGDEYTDVTGTGGHWLWVKQSGSSTNTGWVGK